MFAPIKEIKVSKHEIQMIIVGYILYTVFLTLFGFGAISWWKNPLPALMLVIIIGVISLGWHTYCAISILRPYVIYKEKIECPPYYVKPKWSKKTISYSEIRSISKDPRTGYVIMRTPWGKYLLQTKRKGLLPPLQKVMGNSWEELWRGVDVL